MSWSVAVLLLLVLILILQIVMLWSRLRQSAGDTETITQIQQLEEKVAGFGALLREEFSRNREENSIQAKHAREEQTSTITKFGTGLQQTLHNFTTLNDNRSETLRATLEERLKNLQEDNTKSLEKMRLTVDEKLQSTLETRISESFKTVSERLEAVHKGLGEMQSLAGHVGDLKRVMSDVKTRGIWGEVQLGALLEQLLSPAQYEKNVMTKPGSQEVVEYAIKLPGRDALAGDVVWLPIDAKFPLNDYEALIDAQDAADRVAVDAASKALEAKIKSFAKDIATRYLSPPATTDFAILFLPTEGLYAEIVRRTQLVELLQRDFRVTVAGPSTITAILNSLQMGFRTLAIEQRSSEVWRLLAGVKTEFGKFGGLLEGLKKKLDQASSNIDDAARRSRAIERKLKEVQELPAQEATELLGIAEGLDALPELEGPLPDDRRV